MATGKRSPHDPFLDGNNVSYIASGYFPNKELEKILPGAMSIPSDEVMAKEYPMVKKMEGMHPFLLMLSKCNDVKPLGASYVLPQYKELLFYFPVIYTHKKKEQQLCSYVPVLYLDYFVGVLGGLTFGLRKQYHPKMQVEETATSRSYMMKNILDASFHQTSMDSREELDPFLAQIFKYATVTVSYLGLDWFYTASVYPKKVLDASCDYEWRYRGSVLKSNENTFANYSEYYFTISTAMRYNAYFHPAAPQLITN